MDESRTGAAVDDGDIEGASVREAAQGIGRALGLHDVAADPNRRHDSRAQGGMDVASPQMRDGQHPAATSRPYAVTVSHADLRAARRWTVSIITTSRTGPPVVHAS